MPATSAGHIAGLDGYVNGLLSSGGGSLKVLLLNNGVEVSGNGYARGTVSSFSAAAAIFGGAIKRASSAVTFTASGGSIVFNEVQVRNAAATVTYQSRKVPTVTVTSGNFTTYSVAFATGDGNMRSIDSSLFMTPNDPAVNANTGLVNMVRYGVSQGVRNYSMAPGVYYTDGPLRIDLLSDPEIFDDIHIFGPSPCNNWQHREEAGVEAHVAWHHFNLNADTTFWWAQSRPSDFGPVILGNMAFIVPMGEAGSVFDIGDPTNLIATGSLFRGLKCYGLYGSYEQQKTTGWAIDGGGVSDASGRTLNLQHRARFIRTMAGYEIDMRDCDWRGFDIEHVSDDRGIMDNCHPGIVPRGIITRGIPQYNWPATLTTRTDNNTGVLTMDDADHNLKTGTVVALSWVAAGTTGYRPAMTVTSVSGTTVNVDGGTDIPPASPGPTLNYLPSGTTPRVWVSTTPQTKVPGAITNCSVEVSWLTPHIENAQVSGWNSEFGYTQFMNPLVGVAASLPAAVTWYVNPLTRKIQFAGFVSGYNCKNYFLNASVIHLRLADADSGESWRGVMFSKADAQTGVITMTNASHKVKQGQVITLRWAGGLRTGITVGPVSGTQVEIGNDNSGSGTDIPVATTQVYVEIPLWDREVYVTNVSNNAIDYMHYNNHLTGAVYHGTLDQDDSDTGEVTMADAVHNIWTGEKVDLFWSSGTRRNLTVGTVSGTSVPVDGGTGDNLPAGGSTEIMISRHVSGIGTDIEINRTSGLILAGEKSSLIGENNELNVVAEGCPKFYIAPFTRPLTVTGVTSGRQSDADDMAEGMNLPIVVGRDFEQEIVQWGVNWLGADPPISPYCNGPQMMGLAGIGPPFNRTTRSPIYSPFTGHYFATPGRGAWTVGKNAENIPVRYRFDPSLAGVQRVPVLRGKDFPSIGSQVTGVTPGLPLHIRIRWYCFSTGNLVISCGGASATVAGTEGNWYWSRVNVPAAEVVNAFMSIGGVSEWAMLEFWQDMTPAYTVTNLTLDRSLDANGVLDQTADVLGQLITDLQGLGVVG